MSTTPPQTPAPAQQRVTVPGLDPNQALLLECVYAACQRASGTSASAELVQRLAVRLYGLVKTGKVTAEGAVDVAVFQ